jgi:predicted permease
MDRWLYKLALRLRTLFRSAQLEQDLDDELQYHLERQTAEYVARGLTPNEARAAALRRMGGVDQSKEACRDAHGLRWFEDLLQDLRYAFRMIRRNPGFTVVVVLSLALGIGANTAIFSAIDAVMLRALPVRDPGQLVIFTWDQNRQTPEQYVGHIHGDRGRVFSAATFEQIRDRNEAFSDTFAIAGNGEVVNVRVGSGADLAHVQGVSWNYFEALGIRPMFGRGFWLDDDREAASPVAIVSHRFWQRHLGQDPSIVGKTVGVNGSPLTVIGVTPPEFFGLQPGTGPDLWIPLSLYLTHQRQQGNTDDGLSYDDNPKSWWLAIVGRLEPGTDRQKALSSLQLLFQQSLDPLGTAAHDDKMPRIDLTSVTYGLEELRAQFSTSLFFLMGIVGMVLLIACANVAGLLLARMNARQREIGLRLSLGAARSRIVRQLLTESVLLAVIGGATGLLVAFWINSALLALILLPLQVNSVVLVFTAATSMVTGVAFGLAPALRGTRIPLFATLKQSLTAAATGQRLTSRKVLAAVQVAICLLLLMVAGLFLRTLEKLQTVDLGFDRTHLCCSACTRA